MMLPLKVLAQGSAYQSYAIGSNGSPVAGANVRICTSAGSGTPCTPLASLFSDPALSVPISNPITADTLGNYTFTVQPGLYLIQISGSGVTTYSYYVSVMGPPGVQTVTFSSTPVFNAISTSVFKMTMAGNVTSSSVTNPFVGQQITFNLCQPSSGGTYNYTFAWPSNFNAPVPALTTGIGACTNASFIYNGTNWFLNGYSAFPVGGTGAVQSDQSGSFYGDQNLTYTPGTKTLADPLGFFEAFMEDCGGQVYNVQCPTYGATGTGFTHDDTAAINAAITAACAVGGGSVVFPVPSSYYNVTNLVVGCSNTSLDGLGHWPKIKASNSVTGDVIEFIGSAPTSNVGIRNLEIDGSMSGTNSTQTVNVDFEAVNNGWVVDSYIHDGGAANVCFDCGGGISTTRSTNVFVRNDSLGATHNTHFAGLQFGNGNSNTTGPAHVEGLTITDTSQNDICLDINGFSHVVVNGLAASGCAGVQVESGSGPTNDIDLGNLLVQNDNSTSGAGVTIAGELSSTTGGEIQRVTVHDAIFHNVWRGIRIISLSAGGPNTIADVTLSNILVTGTQGGSGYLLEDDGATATDLQAIKIQGGVVDGAGSEAGNKAGIVVLAATNGVTNLAINGVTVRNEPSGGVGFYTNTPVSNQGQISLVGNNLANNPAGETNLVSYLNVDRLHMPAWTPTSSANQSWEIPVAGGNYLVAFNCMVTGTAGAYTEIRALWGVASFASGAVTGFAPVSTNVYNLTQSNGGLNATVSMTTSIPNTVSFSVTNATNNVNPCQVTATGIGFNAASF